MNGTIFEKKIIEHKMRFELLYNVWSETFLIVRRNENFVTLCPEEPNFSMRPDGRTDRHEEAMIRFSQF